MFAVGGLAGVLLLGILQFQGVSTWLVGRLAGAFNPYPGTVLTVERAGGSWIRSLRLEGVRLTAAEGQSGGPEIALDSLAVSYRLLPLLIRRLDIRRVDVEGLRAELTQGPDSVWNVLEPFQGGDEDKGESKFVVRLGSTRVSHASIQVTFAPREGSADPDRMDVEELELSLGGLEAGGGRMVASLDTVRVRFLPPGELLDTVVLEGAGSLADGRVEVGGLTLRSGASDVAVAGTLLLPRRDGGEVEDVDFRVRATPLAFRDLSGFVRSLDPAVTLQADLSVRGRASLVEVSGEGTFSDGGRVEVDGAFTPLADGPVEYRFTAAATGLRPASFLGEGSLGGVVDGRADVDLGGADLAHLGGDLSVLLEGVRFDGRAIRPLVVSGGFTDGEADLEVDAGAEGGGVVHVSVGGRPLDPEPSLRLAGRFLQSGSLPDRTNPLERFGATDLEARFALETRGFSVDSAVAEVEAEVLGGSLRGLSLEGGTVKGSWNGGEGTFALTQPLGTGRLSTTGQVAWRTAPGTGVAAGRVLRYSLPDLELREVDASALLGDTLPSRVNATASLAGVGTDPSILEATLVARVQASEFRGMALDSAVAGIRARPSNARQVLILDSLRFSGVDLASAEGGASHLDGVARGRMEGLDPRSATASGHVALTPSRIRDAVVDAAALDVSLSEGLLRLSGQLESDDGSVRWDGSAHPFAEPLDFSLAEGTIRALNLGPFLGREGLVTSLGADVRLSGSVGSLRELVGSGQVVFQPSIINRGEIRAGTLDLEAGGGEGSVRGELRTGGGEVTLQASAPLDETLDHVRAEGQVDLSDLGELLGLPDIAVEARGSVATTWTVAEGLDFTSELEGRVGDAVIDTLAVAGSFGASVLRLDTLRVRSEVLLADGGGRWALEGAPGDGAASDLRVSATFQDVSPLGPLLGLGEIAVESGGGDLRVTGPPGAPSLEASLVVGPWLLRGVVGDSVRVRTTYAPDDVTLAVRVVGPRGTGSLDLSVWADPRPDEARGVVRRLDAVTDGAQWTLEAPVPFSWGRGSRIDHLVLLSADHGRISVDGILDRRGTQDLTVAVEDASLSGLARLLRRDDLTLLVDGRMHLTGPAASPRAEGELRMDVGVGGGGLTSMDARYSFADGALTLDAQAADTAGGELTLRGAIPLEWSLAEGGQAAGAASPVMGDADFTLLSQGLDISWVRGLFPQGTVADLSGVFTADARATGPADRLVWEGQIGLKDGVVRVGAAGTSYRDIDIAAEVGNQGVRITRASVVSGSGSAEVQGRVALDGFAPGDMDLSARMDRFLAWNSPLVSATLTGDLSLTGRVQEPRIAGNLNLEGSKLGLDGVSSGSELEAVELTEEDYEMLEDYFGYRVRRRAATPASLAEGVGLDLTVSFDRDVFVRRARQPTVALEVQGDLRIEKEPAGALRAVGTIATLPGRSYFRQFGRRFSVKEGELVLNGPPSEFSFRMEAEWAVSSYSNPDEDEVVVNLGVVGDAETLELTLSSDPSMDEADIVSYLATGKPQSALASSDADPSEVSGLGASMAAGALGSVLEEWAGETVNLDVMEVQVDPVKGTTLVAGRYVSPDVYLGFRQLVTFSETSKKDRSASQGSAAELEYRWFRWLTMNVRGGASEIRVFLKARHAY